MLMLMKNMCRFPSNFTVNTILDDILKLLLGQRLSVVAYIIQVLYFAKDNFKANALKANALKQLTFQNLFICS